jgi:hypothetical protein
MPNPPAAFMTPIVDGGEKSDVLLVFFSAFAKIIVECYLRRRQWLTKKAEGVLLRPR